MVPTMNLVHYSGMINGQPAGVTIDSDEPMTEDVRQLLVAMGHQVAPLPNQPVESSTES